MIAVFGLITVGGWVMAGVMGIGMILMAICTDGTRRKVRGLKHRLTVLGAALDHANHYSLHFRDWEQDGRDDWAHVDRKATGSDQQ